MAIKKDKNIGQVILIILLVMTVGLTIGLSLVSRTINDIKISSQIADSSKAFSAAESGVESALKGAQIGAGNVNVNVGGASATYSVSTLGGSTSPFVIPQVAVGDTKAVWLIEHNDDGSLPSASPFKNNTGISPYTSPGLDVCWGPKGNIAPNPVPAIEITLLYYDNSTGKYGLSKLPFDANASGHNNNFNSSAVSINNGANCPGENRYYSVSLKFNAIPPETNFNVPNSIPIFLHVNPLYAATDIVVSPQGGATLPSQGKNISSTGTTTSGVARKLSVLQGYYTLPPIFDYSIYCANCTK